MAFESQLAAQRAFTRGKVRSTEFLLRVIERKRGAKTDVILDVRVPFEIAKSAKLKDAQIDIFWDHESGKGMIAQAMGGLKLTGKDRDAVASQQFVFAKGFTPDFGVQGLRIEKWEVVKHGDHDALQFDYPSVAMVTGRNELKAGEQQTRAQTLAAARVKPEEVRSAVAPVIAPIKTKPPAPAPVKAKKARSKPAKRTRRFFPDEVKKEGVRAHLQWMAQGLNFKAACEKVGVGEPLMYGWRKKFLKDVEREEKKAAGAPTVRAKRLNGAAVAAH